jgi:hypothetical protein
MAAIGTIVVAPYAMIYDMPMIAAAVAIDWKARTGAGVPIKSPEVVLVAALFACILGMVTSLLPFAASVLVFALFLVIAGSRKAALNDGAEPFAVMHYMASIPTTWWSCRADRMKIGDLRIDAERTCRGSAEGLSIQRHLPE